MAMRIRAVTGVSEFRVQTAGFAKHPFSAGRYNLLKVSFAKYKQQSTNGGANCHILKWIRD